MSSPHLSAERVVHSYPAADGGRVVALNGLSFDLARGQTLGIIGASGAGKSTLVRLVLGLERPESGRILIDGNDLNEKSTSERRSLRMKLQVVFQDPRSSLNPHLSLRSIVEEPLLARGHITREERRKRVEQTMVSVGLDPSMQLRKPDALSGGERQRVAIARALITQPEILILDEPVSALDGPIRSQILTLLAEIQANLGLTVVLVSHDVRSTQTLADTVLVLYAGVCVESGKASEVLSNPSHPYTQALLAAIPKTEIGWTIPETVVDADPERTGCACTSWCSMATDQCSERPQLESVTADHRIACWEKIDPLS
jgi:oligopeptide/dipeptide ABC transporter ATP-binding protein